MSVIITDINKMISDSEKLKSIAKKYERTIQNFSILINKMDCWQGPDAQEYIEITNSNIKVYEEVGLVLKEYAEFLNIEAKKIDTLSKEIDEK